MARSTEPLPMPTPALRRPLTVAFTKAVCWLPCGDSTSEPVAAPRDIKERKACHRAKIAGGKGEAAFKEAVGEQNEIALGLGLAGVELQVAELAAAVGFAGEQGGKPCCEAVDGGFSGEIAVKIGSGESTDEAEAEIGDAAAVDFQAFGRHLGDHGARVATALDRAIDADWTAGLVRNKAEIDETCVERQIRRPGVEGAMDIGLKRGIGERETFSMQTLGVAPHPAVQLGRTSEQPVDQAVAKAEIAGLAVEREVEAAGEEIDDPGGGHVNCARQGLPGKAGEWRDIGRDQREAAIQRRAIHRPLIRNAETVVLDRDVGDVERCAGRPVAVEAKIEGLAERGARVPVLRPRCLQSARRP